MKRLLFTLAALAGMALALTAKTGARLLCRKHDPEPYLGGQRCRNCGSVFADLGEAGLLDDGYVPTMRTTYGREPDQGVTRSEWLQ